METSVTSVLTPALKRHYDEEEVAPDPPTAAQEISPSKARHPSCKDTHMPSISSTANQSTLKELPCDTCERHREDRREDVSEA